MGLSKGEGAAGQGVGPGSVRVGRLIGRLGVVSLPAVGVALGLAERVVRRHVSRLEGLGWLGRVAGLRGEGSLAWLTAQGLLGVGLGELRAVRAPDPFSAPTLHSVRVAWSAAGVERRGWRWLSARELALEPGRWAIVVANERGGDSRRLPDLVVWRPDSPLPAAVVIERGIGREKRRRAVLAGWAAAIAAGRYARVRYECSDLVLARQLTRMAAEVGLTSPQFHAVEQTPPGQVTAIPAATVPDPPACAAPETSPAPVSAPPAPRPAAKVDPPAPPAQEPPQTPDQAAERQRLINEILGLSAQAPPPLAPLNTFRRLVGLAERTVRGRDRWCGADPAVPPASP